MVLGRFAKRISFLQGGPPALQAMLYHCGNDGRFRAQQLGGFRVWAQKRRRICEKVKKIL
jgi:hypothetical protein